MTITAIIENTSHGGLPTEHGLSLHLRMEDGRNVLFDMGQSDLLLRNAEALGVGLDEVNLAVLSHGHYDHGGGMVHFLERTENIPLYINENAFSPAYSEGEKYIGLDACAADLMRPAMYGAYHHITVLGKEDAILDHVYDVTGGLCENNDKFAIERSLPAIDIGDILVIHDTGAHGHSMGYNYNGKLKSAEILLKEDGSFELIRRAETAKDYFATFDFTGLFD